MDSDVITVVEDTIGIVAGDNYEGWSEYWEDVAVYKERIRTILIEWEELCKSKVA
jgi:hypothetical protein